MQNGRTWMGAVIALGLVAAVGYPLYAAGGAGSTAAKDLLKKMEEEKITLVKAIDAAESHTKGKAVSATATMHDKDVTIDVYCVKGEEIFLAVVDGKNGKVTKSDPVSEIGGQPTNPAPSKPDTKPQKPKDKKP